MKIQYCKTIQKKQNKDREKKRQTATNNNN